MINDEERREAAARLRKMLAYMRARKDWYCRDADTVECGNAAYRNIAKSIEPFGNMISGNYVHIVERLAELIDPQKRTCKIEWTYDDEFGIYDNLTCGHVAMRQWHEPTNYCPICGAEVVE